MKTTWLMDSGVNNERAKEAILDTRYPSGY